MHKAAVLKKITIHHERHEKKTCRFYWHLMGRRIVGTLSKTEKLERNRSRDREKPRIASPSIWRRKNWKNLSIAPEIAIAREIRSPKLVSMTMMKMNVCYFLNNHKLFVMLEFTLPFRWLRLGPFFQLTTQKLLAPGKAPGKGSRHLHVSQTMTCTCFSLWQPTMHHAWPTYNAMSPRWKCYWWYLLLGTFSRLNGNVLFDQESTAGRKCTVWRKL